MRTYQFKDGEFKFYYAQYGSMDRDKRIVFRVRVDRDPKERAREKGIAGWDRIIQVWEGQEWMIEQWFATHQGMESIA
jgi:hypothetical protein